jgi:type VI protein secretion system component VasK
MDCDELLIAGVLPAFLTQKTRERGMEMTETGIVAIAVAAISLVGNLVGSFLAHRKSTALISYRLEQLEKKVDKHNSVIERTYQLEKRCEVIEEKIKVANHRIEDLEKAEKAVVRR